VAASTCAETRPDARVKLRSLDLKGEERVFITGPTPTMSGPACRSSRGTYTLPASIEALFAHFAEMREQAEGKPAKTVSAPRGQVGRLPVRGVRR
jgi:hypothetical protein